MSKYSEKDISYFSTELEKIRAKPQMYMGSTDDDGIFTILREPADNAVDEHRAGRNNLIHIFVTTKDFWVVDEGVGIPVKKHPEAKISTLTHVLTALQSSGKMKGDAYKSAIGTHGCGVKITNALSTSFDVWTFREADGGWYHTSFASGVETSGVQKSKPPKLPDGKSPKKGTIVRFVPDKKIFKDAKLPVSRLKIWAELTSYMNAGLRIKVTNPKGNTQEWYSKEGIKAYLEKRLVDLGAEATSKKPIMYVSDTLEVALHFTDCEGCQVEFFTNTIRNVDLGFHADSMFRALVESLKPYKGKNDFTLGDVKDGLLGVLNYKIDAPQFSSQTKEKLVDTRMKEPCYKESLVVFGEYFKANKALAKQICERAAELRKKTNQFMQDKKLIKNVKDAKKKLSTKLAGIEGNAPIEKRELFLVEGDSAGGSAKKARHNSYQAVFPLKGKPLNVMETTTERVNNNEEIATILAAVGASAESEDTNYGRIIFLADADVDGSHVNTLLLTVFWKYMPHLFKAGKIFMVESPEYLCIYKNKTYFGQTKDDLYKQISSKNLDIQHLKGWGELDAVDMRPVVFDPGSRRLLRVLPPKDKKGKLQFEALMGKDSGYRKKLLGII